LTTDHLLWATWTELERSLRKDKQPVMPASRHLMLGHLFGPNPNSPLHRLNEHTVHLRFRAEILLHLVKCKGMVNASVMAQDTRIHRYYERLKREVGGSDEGGADLLSRLSKEAISRSRYADVKETYFTHAKTLNGIHRLFKDFIGGGQVYEPTFNERIGVVEWSEMAWDAFLKKHISNIFNGPEVEISRAGEPQNEWHFSRSTALPTYFALQNKTRALLRDPSWTHLLVIAESGAWIGEHRDLLYNATPRSILLLQASQKATEEWQLRRLINKDLESLWVDLANNNCPVVRGQLLWWQHNRHMTLAFDVNTGFCVGGVYFRRRLKVSRIHPIYIGGTDREDSAELLLTFLSYVRRAIAENPTTNSELRRATQELVSKAQVPESYQERLQRFREELTLPAKAIAARDGTPGGLTE
jgi:hypothetical protein